MDKVDTGHHLEQFSGNVLRGPHAAGAHVELARITHGVGNEFRDGLDRD
jgi:hypothetical protein